ncbi:MAG: exo-alpha-sialidase [Nitrospirae bacterium]|nr:exo-alpha-sialidase [Nitrospirota bacterium]
MDNIPSDTWVKESGFRIGPGGSGSSDVNGAQTQDVMRFPAGTPVLNPDGTITLAPTDFIRMYYGGINSASLHRILSAVSFDEGLTWTKEPGIRVSVIADEDIAYHPSVVPLAGGGFRMYIESLQSGGQGRIRSATSSDGLNWSRDSGDRLTNALDPEVIELPGGDLRMYFVRGRDILSAVSNDGISWTEEPGVRIAKGPPGALDAVGVSHHYVIRLPDGQLLMYYTAADGVTPLVHANGQGRAILSAVSGDGLNWVKETGIRIDLGSSGSLDAGGLLQPAVLQLSDGSFRMFYQGIISPSQRFILSAQAVPKIRLIDTISTSNIDLDSTSFSKQPASITNDAANNKTIIEWQYDSFSIGQIEDISFDVILKNPIPGEDRLVNHKLELLYTDVNGNPVRTELGPQSVHVLASAFTTSIFTDKTEYIANENAQIGLSITNLSEFGRTIDAVLEIKDTKGNLVTTVKNLTGLSFVSGETKSFQGIIWNTGSTPAGNYTVQTRLIEAGAQVGEAKSDFKISPDKSATSKIVSDKTSYSSNETVTLTSTVTSQSINSTITKPTAKVSVTDPNGSAVFSETKNLPDLLPSARYEFKSFANTGINPSGSYTATLEVRQTGEMLSVSSTSFTILSSLDQAKALSGTIIVDPGTIFEKETTTLTYTIQNTGNDIDLPAIQIEILIVDPDTGISLRTMTDETSLNGREVFQGSIIFDSTGLVSKSYLVVLQGITAGIIQTLASTGLIINPIPNNAPMADAGPDQSGLAGQQVNLDGTKSSDPDGDVLSFIWHFVSVPQGSLISDSSFLNAAGPAPSFTPDIDGIYTIGLIVNDGLLPSQQDLVSVFVNPAPEVDIHPETINLKSNGGSKSITGILSSPILSSFSFFTATDGVTVTASFTLENSYIDKNGNQATFTVPQDNYTGDDYVMLSDSDANGIDDTYQITLKFNRDLIISGFKDQNGKLKITKPTDLISTIIGNGIRIGSDTNLVISPPEVQ